MIFKLPNVYFLVSGKGEGNTKLNAFDHAIMNAGVGNTNLMRLSSILPPNAEKIKPIALPYGALIPIAYSFLSTDENRVISASIALGINIDKNKPGLIMEYSNFDDQETVEKKCIKMVEEGFAFRKEKLKEIESISISHHKQDPNLFACVFCGIVLWDK